MYERTHLYFSYIESERPLKKDKNVFTSELPAVSHIFFRVYMAFVFDVKVYKAIVCLSFDFLQFLGLICKSCEEGVPFGCFSSISRANAKN